MNNQERLKKISFFDVHQDLSSLTEKEKLALYHCITASSVITNIYLKQVFPEGYKVFSNSGKQYNPLDPESEATLRYFDVVGGPWDEFNENEPFIEGVGPKPKIGPFYPSDLTEAEWKEHLAAHPEDREAFESNYTVIIRDENRSLKAIPYSEYYREDLIDAAFCLKEAAELLDPSPLKTFLSLRSQALLSNDYFESELAWIDTDGYPFEVTIGPYEVYADSLFGIKAMFEAFVALPDKDSTTELQKFACLVPDFDARLAEKWNYKPKGAAIPLEVVVDVYRGGEGAFGRQYVAYNLPNDRRIHELKGSKKVFSRTMMEAKFNTPGDPIARKILSPSDYKYYKFRNRLLFVLCHELSHGIGPGTRLVDGREVSFEVLLKDLHSSIEEAKADMLGMELAQFFFEHKLINFEEMTGLVVTEVVHFVQGWRASFTEAHSKGSLVEYNWLKYYDAVYFDDHSGQFVINARRSIKAMIHLGHEFLSLQTAGDYERARVFMEKWGFVSPEIPAIVDSLRHLPIEVHPVYQV